MKMILAGEPHPEFPLQSIISALALEAAFECSVFFGGGVRRLYCRLRCVLNLRWPTVRRSSATCSIAGAGTRGDCFGCRIVLRSTPTIFA